MHNLRRQVLLNEAPWRPQDYDYLKALTPAAQRFYEIVSAKFYNSFRFSNLNASKIAYSEVLRLLGATALLRL